MVFIACVDGLKGFPEAIEAMYPQAQVQLCIVHLVRASLNYVSWKECKQVAQNLKAIYRAATAEQAEQEVAEFGAVGTEGIQRFPLSGSGTEPKYNGQMR